MAASAFSAGNITLSNFLNEASSLNPNFTVANNSPATVMLIPTGASFDFNWSGNATQTNSLPNFGTANSPPQQIGGSGSDNVQLVLTLATNSKGWPVATQAGGGSIESAGITIAGNQQIAPGDNTTPNSTVGDSVTLTAVGGANLASLLQQVEFVDTVKGDVFQINFTLTDETTTASTTFSEAFRVVSCYAVGTRIATPSGELAVEDLQIGDLIRTAAGAAKPVKWLGRRSYSADAVAAARQLVPVLIRKDALGSGLPARDLMVSPMHALHIDDSFIPASALVNGVSILRRETAGAAEYIHVELHDHDVILAEGVPAETFVDDDSRTNFDNASEYYDLYGFAASRRGYSVPRLEEGYRLEAIRRRIAARAGIAPSAAVPGEMAGHVERLSDSELEGWVMDQANPANPVELEVLVDGEIVATVLANRYRPDLDRAGLADGRCAFSVTMPAAASELGQVAVRRATDGGQVAMPVRTPVAA
jgi:hypothetical protein